VLLLLPLLLLLPPCFRQHLPPHPLPYWAGISLTGAA